ncbi:MAG: four helix bundle protein [Acidobacteria bacterium]|nr:four helix bundle protein [Acidobacteriota bacterium]NIM60543.1 four helix bundle protein [Acidobacteriota bacterium]NIO59514.1 four helix bundle protein [Acidobacteriota bacterium]NIQ30543.1 four helix bundle protein [Acidobacteriota bacterium]NIQ85491.1 four helix bundle protein [Acidobacteriota bacterium]
MAALSQSGRRVGGAGGWLETFRAGDAWVVASWEAAAALAPGTGELARRMRRGALDCGCALVAAAQCSAGEDRRGYIERAHGSLMEARYLLYLAKRVGSLDSKRYKALTTRLDRALREITARRLS